MKRRAPATRGPCPGDVYEASYSCSPEPSCCKLLRRVEGSSSQWVVEWLPDGPQGTLSLTSKGVKRIAAGAGTAATPSSVAAKAPRYGDSSGDALSDKGLRQVAFKLTAKQCHFRDFASHGEPTAVYASPAVRALHSASAAFPGMRIVADPRLRELGACVRGRAEIRAELADAVGKEAAACVDLDNVPEGGVPIDSDEHESPPKGAPLVARQISFLEDLEREHGDGADVAVFGHCAFFRSMAVLPWRQNGNDINQGW